MTQDQIRTKLDLHKKWLEGETGGALADLTGADLRSALLTGSDLTGADLTSAILRGAILRGADLTGADLRSADLRRAILRSADLTGADLTGAVLTGAVLHESIGVQHASCSWSGHGERGRQLLSARIGGEIKFWCGCFSGTREDLQTYINKGREEYKPSRQKALDFVASCFE